MGGHACRIRPNAMVKADLRVIIVLSACAVLSACGGGDGVSPTTPPISPPVPAPVPLPSDPPSGLPVDPTPTPPVEETCADWGELLAGDYQYLNNVWNKGTIADYEQCVMRRVVDGEDQYGWRWRWPNGGGEVKALPQVLFGQSPWRKSSTTPSLPRQISALETLRVEYELYIAAEGDFSLAFILWLTNTDPPTPEAVSHNVKIQVYRSGPAPAPAVSRSVSTAFVST